MATRFEIVMYGDNSSALRAAGEEALAEIEKLEDQLSLYRPSSEIAHLNARAAAGPVRVTPSLFALLREARRLHDLTDGAFDVTIAPLVRCWGFMGGQGRMPEPEAVEMARRSVGMRQITLDEQALTVRFAREGVMIDLGAIGKGYAVERAAEILRENGVTSALLHGGTSTVYSIGHPPDLKYWDVALEQPPEQLAPAAIPTVIHLRDEAMSVSAIWGRSFQVDGKLYGHVLDPRTGYPAKAVFLAAVVSSSATETDALSTALLINGQLPVGIKTLVISEHGVARNWD
jgi:thiamine biosynthesis lipoprotein